MLGTMRQAHIKSWMTKPTDRFVLRWIKVNLAAPVSRHLAGSPWVRPWMATVANATLGIAGGIAYGSGHPEAGAMLAATAQVLDGVDGQIARLTAQESARGAYLDSVLDRYTDGAMVVGSLAYLMRTRPEWPRPALWLLGGAALLGSNAVSYSGARGEALGLDVGQATRASKGTRSAVNVAAALLAGRWPGATVLALLYLALHPNAAVLNRLLHARVR